MPLSYERKCNEKAKHKLEWMVHTKQAGVIILESTSKTS